MQPETTPQLGERTAIQIWQVLYPNGIPPDHYPDALAVAELTIRAPAVTPTAPPLEGQPLVGGIYTDPVTKIDVDPKVVKSFYSPAQLAKLRGMSANAIYDAIKKGRLKARQMDSGEFRIAANDAESFYRLRRPKRYLARGRK